MVRCNAYRRHLTKKDRIKALYECLWLEWEEDPAPETVPMSTKEIADAVGAHEDTVRDVRRKMLKDVPQEQKELPAKKDAPVGLTTQEEKLLKQEEMANIIDNLNAELFNRHQTTTGCQHG